MTSSTLTVLARSPAPGRGKSRLRAALHPHAPAAAVDRLVHALVADTLGWAAQCGRRLVLAGRGDLDALSRMAGGAHTLPQPEGPFGARIEAAVAGGLLLASGATTVQIGSDSPTLPPGLLDRCYEALTRGSDCVLVPALDGGWVALGARAPLDGALAATEIRWSTAHAAADTLNALRARRLEVSVTEAWYDVDCLDGLRRLALDPLSRTRAPRTLAAIHALAGPGFGGA